VKEKLEAYLLKVPEYQDMASSTLIDYFTYFLTVLDDHNAVQASDIDACLSLTRLDKYSNISSYLSRNSKKVGGKKPNSSFGVEKHP